MNSLAEHRIRDANKLSTILWIDFAVGVHLGGLGLGFYPFFTSIFALPQLLVIWISSATILYSIFVFNIAKKKTTSILLLRILVYGNWFWTIIIIGIISLHYSDASILGKLFLNLEIIIAAAFAWIKGNQLEKLDD